MSETSTTTTTAQTNTDGGASTGASAADSAAPTATLTADASIQSQDSSAQSTQDAANTAEGQSKAGDKDPADAASVVPEKYEFTMPTDIQMDAGSVEAFSEFARDAGLSQEAAQKMMDKMAPAMQARQAAALDAARSSWLESSKADKEFGGANLTENLSVAKKAIDAFGTPELRTLLEESGLGNHPELIRAFYRAGKQISEDRFVPSGMNGARSGGRDPAASLYPNQT